MYYIKNYYYEKRRQKKLNIGNTQYCRIYPLFAVTTKAC